LQLLLPPAPAPALRLRRGLRRPRLPPVRAGRRDAL